MTRIAAALGALVISVAVSAADTAEPLVLPSGARVGHLNLMTGDITHYHKGRRITDGFLRTYQATWSAGGTIDALLAERLTRAGLTPVHVVPTYVLERYRDRLYAPRAPGDLHEECAVELARLADELNLDALLILAPGLNDTVNAGGRGKDWRDLPDYTRGWGVLTEDGMDQPTLFNLSHLMLVTRNASGVRLHGRDWGGAHSRKWSDFVAPADLRSLPAQEIGKLEPLFGDIIGRQVDRLFVRLAVQRAAATTQ